MRGSLLGTLALALFAPSAALAAPCEGSPDLPGAVESAREQIGEDPAAVAASLSGVVGQLTCLTEPPEPADLAAMWQLLGVAQLRTGQEQAGKAALIQAASMPVDEMVVAVDDIDALEPYINAYSADWKLGRLNVGPVSVDAAIHVDGIRQSRTFAPVKAPAQHLVQVFEGDALVFSELVAAPEGDLDVSTEVDPDEQREREKAAEIAAKLAEKQAKAQAKAQAKLAKAEAKAAKAQAKALAKAGEPDGDDTEGDAPVDADPAVDAPVEPDPAVADAGKPEDLGKPAKAPKPPKAPGDGGSGKTIRAISLGAGGVALGLGAGALYFNQQTSTFLSQGDGYSAARAFDASRALGISAGGLGAASLLGLGLSFTLSGRF